MPTPPQLVFRPQDETTAANLKALSERNNRTVSDELRAAASIYLDLVNLAHFRIIHPVPGREVLLANAERRVKDNIGRVLLAALPNDVESAFEDATGVEYPVGAFGPIDTPFDQLLLWIVSGKAEP